MFRAAAALQERERESPFAHSPELPVTLADLIPSSGPWHSTSLNFSLLQQQQPPSSFLSLLLLLLLLFSLQYKSPSFSHSLSHYQFHLNPSSLLFSLYASLLLFHFFYHHLYRSVDRVMLVALYCHCRRRRLYCCWETYTAPSRQEWYCPGHPCFPDSFFLTRTTQLHSRRENVHTHTHTSLFYFFS